MNLGSKKYLITFFSIFTFFFLGSKAFSSAEVVQINSILELTIKSSINPATLNYLKFGFKKAKKENHGLILIKLNTPGGLVSTTKEIITLIGESAIPTAIWITPEGSSATSAGAIIASSAHILIMSSGTNIGAATPITMGKELGKDVKTKAVNDLVALVQSLSETRNRNAEAFGKMISEAISFKAKEALEKKLIEGIANSHQEFLNIIQQRNITVKGTKIKLVTQQNNVKVESLDMDLGQWLLDIFANPNMAYILFLLGAALLYFEFQAPGGFISGSVGVIALLLSAIGFHVLPINLGAMGLIVLAFILFVLEAFIVSYGILSIAGMTSLFVGSVFLFRSENGYMELKSSIIYSAVGSIGIFLLFIFFFLVKDFRKKRTASFFKLKAKEGVITEIVDELEDNNSYYKYKIKVHGEIWNASSIKKYNVGDQVKVSNKPNTEKLEVDIIR